MGILLENPAGSESVEARSEHVEIRLSNSC